MTRKPAAAGSASKETFESSLETLEGVLRELESGEKGLEESLALFEKGVGLAKTLTAQLEEAKHKVSVLVKDGKAGALERKPYEEPDAN
ncbi:MAG: exodeoxyribonuclease VII small subunit [Elusimicrobia bacterium]|nr:exodeoxyribonuclease VII small subunit [Elusimicrobiota bacterium]